MFSERAASTILTTSHLFSLPGPFFLKTMYIYYIMSPAKWQNYINIHDSHWINKISAWILRMKFSEILWLKSDLQLLIHYLTFQKMFVGSGEMAQLSRVLAALAGGWSSALSTHIRLLMSTWNSSSRGFHTLLCLPQALKMGYTLRYTHTHINTSFYT